tara:strand:- start:112 stop:273 length:162 start_codon:yes stop_codon:yes gene_type:complete
MFEVIIVLLILYLMAKETGRTYPKFVNFWDNVAVFTSVLALIVSVSGLVGYLI